jgi:hypothetical protein
VLYWPRMEDHGRSWFVGAIFLISFFTYGLAVYIGAVLGFLKNFFKIPQDLRPGDEEKKNKKKVGPEEPLNLWRGLAPSLIWIKQNWVVGDFKQKEGEVQEDNSKSKDWKRGFKWIKANWVVGDFKEQKEGEVQEEDSKPKDPPNLWRRGLKWMKVNWLVSDFHEDDRERESREKKPKPKDSPNIWRGITSSFKRMKANWAVHDSREDDREREARESKSNPEDPLNAAEQGKAKLGNDSSTEPNGLMANVTEVATDAV